MGPDDMALLLIDDLPSSQRIQILRLVHESKLDHRSGTGNTGGCRLRDRSRICMLSRQWFGDTGTPGSPLYIPEPWELSRIVPLHPSHARVLFYAV